MPTLRYEFQTEIYLCDDSIVIEIEVTGKFAALPPWKTLRSLPDPLPEHPQDREIVSVRTFTSSGVGPAGYVRYSKASASAREVLDDLFMPYVMEADLDAEVMEACDNAAAEHYDNHA